MSSQGGQSPRSSSSGQRGPSSDRQDRGGGNRRRHNGSGGYDDNNNGGGNRPRRALDPFEVFAHYVLGLDENKNFRAAGQREVARRFGVGQNEVQRAIQIFKMDNDSLALMRPLFDRKYAQLDIKVAPDGIDRREIALGLWAEFVDAGIAKGVFERAPELDDLGPPPEDARPEPRPAPSEPRRARPAPADADGNVRVAKAAAANDGDEDDDDDSDDDDGDDEE